MPASVVAEVDEVRARRPATELTMMMSPPGAGGRGGIVLLLRGRLTRSFDVGSDHGLPVVIAAVEETAIHADAASTTMLSIPAGSGQQFG